MSSKSLSMLLFLPLGLALSACGDDSDAGGSGTDTDPTSTSMTTATPTTNDPTEDPTADPTEDPTADPTEDPTVDPDSTGPGDTTDPSDTDETTGEGIADANFRVNSLGVLDPPLSVVGISGNQIASDALTGSLTTDDDDDGFLDLGFVLRFGPLDQSDGASEMFGFANAICTAPQRTSTCDILEGSVIEDTTYSSSARECYAADPTNLSPSSTVPTPAAGPCFIAEFDSATIQAGLFDLPLANVTVAATFVGDPAGNLVNGTIEGFVTQAVAESVNVVVDPVYDGPLSGLLDAADMDEGDTGWVFHLSFTALPTDWTGA